MSFSVVNFKIFMPRKITETWYSERVQRESVYTCVMLGRPCAGHCGAARMVPALSTFPQLGSFGRARDTLKS